MHGSGRYQGLGSHRGVVVPELLIQKSNVCHPFIDFYSPLPLSINNIKLHNHCQHAADNFTHLGEWAPPAAVLGAEYHGNGIRYPEVIILDQNAVRTVV